MSRLHGCTANHILSPSEVLTGMESYIVQLDFSTVSDRASHSGLLFKLKSIVVGSCVLFICREFLSNGRQRVMVEGATSEWIPIVSGVPQGSALGPLLFIFYTSEMFDLMEKWRTVMPR